MKKFNSGEYGFRAEHLERICGQHATLVLGGDSAVIIHGNGVRTPAPNWGQAIAQSDNPEATIQALRAAGKNISIRRGM